ncbi:MAG: hypothetical protein N4A54_02330 [Peptostreptococcaceae bacterium]|jgi:hypothetical protein|nr:hypothetical protein [Peptostreptococcaceae bacterium]
MKDLIKKNQTQNSKINEQQNTNNSTNPFDAIPSKILDFQNKIGNKGIKKFLNRKKEKPSKGLAFAALNNICKEAGRISYSIQDIKTAINESKVTNPVENISSTDITADIDSDILFMQEALRLGNIEDITQGSIREDLDYQHEANRLRSIDYSNEEEKIKFNIPQNYYKKIDMGEVKSESGTVVSSRINEEKAKEKAALDEKNRLAAIEANQLPDNHSEYYIEHYLLLKNPKVSSTANNEVIRLLSKELKNKDVFDSLWANNVRIVIIPKNESMVDLDQFKTLKGNSTFDGRGWDTTRGAGYFEPGDGYIYAAIGEETLTGEKSSYGQYPKGYSVGTHEFAHTIHKYGLNDAQKAIITSEYKKKKSNPNSIWPDGPEIDKTTGAFKENYSSMNELEYFAQAANAYLNTNTGTDPFTNQNRNNGKAWVRKYEPVLVKLLDEIFSHEDISGANPVI